MDNLKNIQNKVERATNRANEEKRPVPPAEPTSGGGGGAPGGSIVRAEIQSVQASTNGIISVKLLTAADATPDSAFNVYAFGDKSTTDVTKCYPVLATSGKYSIVHIYKANDDNWYIVWPTVDYLGACS